MCDYNILFCYKNWYIGTNRKELKFSTHLHIGV